MTDWEAADRQLLENLERAIAEGTTRAGAHLACRPGCIECCIGPFPITLLDAWRLQRALQELERNDPQRAARIRERASNAIREMSKDFPGDLATGLLNGNTEAEDRFFERHATLPCPVLDPETGLCELYAARPLSCRTFGLPVRIGDQDLPPCRLCFRDASAQEIEACRVAVDPEGLEDQILGDAGGVQTLIAFALTGCGAPARPPASSQRT
jgi:Fe-S-cluster containining protein